jgi:hypothetical protein
MIIALDLFQIQRFGNRICFSHSVAGRTFSTWMDPLNDGTHPLTERTDLPQTLLTLQWSRVTYF